MLPILFFYLFTTAFAEYCQETNEGNCIEVDNCTCPGDIDPITWGIFVGCAILLACICICVACKGGGRSNRF